MTVPWDPLELSEPHVSAVGEGGSFLYGLHHTASGDSQLSPCGSLSSPFSFQEVWAEVRPPAGHQSRHVTRAFLPPAPSHSDWQGTQVASENQPWNYQKERCLLSAEGLSCWGISPQPPIFAKAKAKYKAKLNGQEGRLITLGERLDQAIPEAHKRLCLSCVKVRADCHIKLNVP